MDMISEAEKMSRKNKKVGSDLVVQRSRYHQFEACFEINTMGMVSEAKTLNCENENIRVGFGRTEVSIPPY